MILPTARVTPTLRVGPPCPRSGIHFLSAYPSTATSILITLIQPLATVPVAFWRTSATLPPEKISFTFFLHITQFVHLLFANQTSFKFGLFRLAFSLCTSRSCYFFTFISSRSRHCSVSCDVQVI